MSPLAKKLMLAGSSTLVALFLAYQIWSRRPAADTVVLIDNREGVADLLEERAEPATGPNPKITTIVPSPSDPLVREPLSEQTVRTMFSALAASNGKSIVYDPQSYYWEVGGIDRTKHFPEHPSGQWRIRTNQMGFRKDREVLEAAPDLRILATGDSHTAGVVPNAEMFANLLESLLHDPDGRTVEALNGGKGGYSFYNYIGVLEKFLELKPEVFVVAAFGGNDFAGTVGRFRYFNRLRPLKPTREFPESVWKPLRKKYKALVSQDLNQIVAFAERPQNVEVVQVALIQILTKIQEICEANGIRFIYVYVPPCSDVQPHLVQEEVDDIATILELSKEELGATERIADRLFEHCEELGVTAIDMRPAYAQSAEPCYWLSDLHINTLGHRLIAEALRDQL